MRRILLAGPGVEPVPLAEMKSYLRLDGSAEDDLVGSLIAAARVAVESAIRSVLIAQSWRADLDDWPASGAVLPIPPVLTVDAVRAIDVGGSATTLAGSATEFDAVTGTVRLLQPRPDAIRYDIDFTAGYGAVPADVPAPLRQAIRLLVAHWYENRSAIAIGEPAATLPLAYSELIAPYRRLTLC